jgi:hypothetical protein
MLTTLEDKINDVHENILTVNEKLKDTLEKVRDSGKICVVSASSFYFILYLFLHNLIVCLYTICYLNVINKDIACILLLVGMIIVLYELVIKE